MSKKQSVWTHDFNVFTSRKDSNGIIYNLSAPLGLVLFLFCVFLINALLWGCIGIYEAVTVIL